MKEMLQIRCKNNKKTISVPIGSTLSAVFSASGLEMPHGAMAAKVNNKVEGLSFRLYHNKDVEFLGLDTPSGLRAYTRTLFFVLCKAAAELWPAAKVAIDTPVSNGYYCDLVLGRPVTDADCAALRQRMQEIIDADMPLRHHECPTEEAIAIFERQGHDTKAQLLRTTGRLYTTYYDIGGYVNYFYGSLLPSTGRLFLFDVARYHEGLLLRVPEGGNPSRLGEMTNQDKMFEVFRDEHRRQFLLGISTVGQFNEAVAEGHATDIINVSEALQERRIAKIADEIAARPDVRLVLIAGPSSSGKTTTCKRLSIQLLACGIRPVPVSLDDYFVDRELTPRDAAGDYDFECLHALNLPLLNDQLTRLFAGEEVELPRYDFPTGRSVKSGRRLRLGQDEVLVLEGIHALNPELTAQVPDARKFRVYASALTSILLDPHNYVPSTDNRLLRRIIRDYKYRAVSAAETIRRWPSVRAGENKWIFPYQENADAMFNTAMIYELAVIKSQAEPLLELVPENCPEHAEAYRLRKFLGYFHEIPYGQLPPTSLLREFLGGSSFTY